MKVIKLPEINNSPLEFVEDRIQDIVDTINQAFIIETSVLDPSRVSIKSRDPKKYKYPPTADTLYLYLKGIGKSVSRSDLRLILRDPNYFEQVDPVREYFDTIRGSWKGESHIDKLCQHICPRVFEGEPEFYTERMHKLIRKWMVACVAQWIDGIPNDITLGFISDQERIGKTYLTRFLMPTVLTEYFVIPTRDQKVSLADLYTRYIAVCFDELVGINTGTARIEEFKSYARAPQILVHRRNDEFPVHRPRIAVSMLTANRNAELGGFLTLDHGLSRFGLIEIDKVDKRYSQRVKNDQLWAEALNLYENSDFYTGFSDEEVKELEEYNKRYVIRTDEEKYVNLYVTMPESNEDEGAEWCTATEVLAQLRQNKKILSADLMSVTPQKFGYALSRSGFESKMMRMPEKSSYPEKRYLVKFQF